MESSGHNKKGKNNSGRADLRCEAESVALDENRKNWDSASLLLLLFLSSTMICKLERLRLKRKI